ncbi:MAG TPA: alpha/beta fold hydrolase [Candidatus Baltobacteraceae bacterium]|nr:alpha/beta fold hydrolase [Candidatus Baltobacteraceae bacterium]
MNVDLHRVDAGFNQIAVLEYEARRARDVALVVGHGYSSSKQNLDGLCAFLASHGFGVYSLDFPGHKLGASGGRLRGVEDLIDAMDAVIAFARRRGAQTLYTVGHSMGATTALCAAGRDPRVAGAVSIATGYGRWAALEALTKGGVVDLRSSYVEGPTLQQLSVEWQPFLDEALVGLAGRPVLFVAAERDAMVTRASVSELYERAYDPKTLATVASDHTFAGDNSRTTVLQWLNAMHPRRGETGGATPLVDAPL